MSLDKRLVEFFGTLLIKVPRVWVVGCELVHSFSDAGKDFGKICIIRVVFVLTIL